MSPIPSLKRTVVLALTILAAAAAAEPAAVRETAVCDRGLLDLRAAASTGRAELLDGTAWTAIGDTLVAVVSEESRLEEVTLRFQPEPGLEHRVRFDLEGDAPGAFGAWTTGRVEIVLPVPEPGAATADGFVVETRAPGTWLGCAQDPSVYVPADQFTCALCEDDPETSLNEDGRCVLLEGRPAAVPGFVRIVCAGVPGFGIDGTLDAQPRYGRWMDPELFTHDDRAAIGIVVAATLPTNTACTVTLISAFSDRDATPIISEPVAFRTAPLRPRFHLEGRWPTRHVLSFSPPADLASVQRGLAVRRVSDGALMPVDVASDPYGELELVYAEPLQAGDHEILLSTEITDLFGVAMLAPAVLPFTLYPDQL